MKKLLFVNQKSCKSRVRARVVKALGVVSCILLSQYLSAQANPPVTPEYIMASGPYANVENTCVDKDPVTGAPGFTTVEVFAWDGDSPAIAQTWNSGSGLEILALPPGAADPDILVGDNGQFILVAYELGNDIVLDLFQNVIGGGSLASAGSSHIINDASHPNLDKPSCQFNAGQYAVVYEDNSGVNDLLLATGSFFPFFLPPTITIVPSQSLAPVSDIYVDRVNPDVLYIEEEVYVTAAGRNTNLGGFYVDIFFVPVGPGPNITGLITPGGPLVGTSSQVFPRIDGFQLNSPGCYEYSLVYGDNNLIYNAYSNTSFGVVSQVGSSNNELPAVSFSGDFHDIIWTATGPGGAYNNEIIGLGAAGCVKDPFYKQVNSVIGAGTMNLYPNISGTCNATNKKDYAMIWWEQNSANIYYKYANAGTTNYKNAGNTDEAVNSNETDFPTLLYKDQFNWDSEKQLELEIRNLSGQLIGLYTLNEFKDKLGSFKNGLYIFKITNKLNQTHKIEKVLIK
tara:strand:+ start:15160 stop:16692 length:1533 start_codon:yes stop_codon:yes gene_type:complete